MNTLYVSDSNEKSHDRNKNNEDSKGKDNKKDNRKEINNLSCIKILGWNMSEHPDFDDRKPDDEPVERPDEGQPLNPFSPDDKRDPII
ncbi:hypothetical protein C0Z43_004708 [Escherichia coli]|nr:hypothetical protein [Escherichia coli]